MSLTFCALGKDMVRLTCVAEKHLLEALGEQMQRTKTENVPREPYVYPPAPVHPTPARKHKAITAKGKSAAHKPAHGVEKGAHEPKRTYRPLPTPPPEVLSFISYILRQSLIVVLVLAVDRPRREAPSGV